MFTLAFILLTLVEGAAWCAAFYGLYRIIFFSSIQKKKQLKEEKSKAEKVAQIILKSSSSKEISEFTKSHAHLLSEDTIKKLSEHLEFINVLSEEPLKARFEELEIKDNSGIKVEEIILDEPPRDVMDILKNPPTLR